MRDFWEMYGVDTSVPPNREKLNLSPELKQLEELSRSLAEFSAALFDGDRLVSAQEMPSGLIPPRSLVEEISRQIATSAENPFTKTVSDRAFLDALGFVVGEAMEFYNQE